jgi:Icc-related predicted phosphoesterase
MKIAFISDTHSSHKACEQWLKDLNKWDEFCNADILCHSGDISRLGVLKEVTAFLEWFNELPNRYKIFIAGNHDFFFEYTPLQEIEELLKKYPNIIYLNDSGITIEGINFWGSPITPWYHNWAFNRTRSLGKGGIKGGIKEHWDLIPQNTDVLLVHGPPFDILDKTWRNDSTGCIDLLNTINLIKPQIVAFGHIHEAYGLVKLDNTLYLNASILNIQYLPANLPHIIEI